MKENIWKKNRIYIILSLIILVQIVYITYTYAYRRDSYHSDEMWTFGLANSTDGPYVYAEDDKITLRHFFEWLDGSVLHEYVSVQKEERFDYASVWYNLGKDDHPPLYFAILHTICSIFAETYSLWYGFAINILAFAVGQFFLFFTAKNVSDSDTIGLAGVILWGTCTGSVSMTIFVRHYAMSIMWAVILMYLYSRMMKRRKFTFRNDILPIAVITFLGCMTNYLFVAFAFFFTGVFVIYFLLTKRYKTCLIFSVSVLAAVGLMCLIYPAAVVRPFQKTAEIDKKANFDYQLLYCIYYTMMFVFGIFTRPYHTMTVIYIEYAIAGVLVILAVLAFLCRSEQRFKQFLKNALITGKKIILVCYIKIKDFPVILIAMPVSMIGIIVLTAWMVNVPGMGACTDRYLSVAFPALSVGILLAVYKFAGLFICRAGRAKLQKILLVICTVVMVWNQLVTVSPYLFRNKDPEYLHFDEIAEITDGADCIIGLGQEWQLTMMPEALSGIHSFFAFSEYGYKTAEEKLEETYRADSGRKLYVLLDESSTNLVDSYGGYSVVYENAENYQYSSDKFVEMIENLSFCKELHYIGYTGFNGVKICLYELKI